MNRPKTIVFEGWTLHRDSGELERDGSRTRMQDLPFQILDELLSRPGEVVTREELIARLWPNTIVDFDTNLNSGVRRLRAALHDDADAPRYIETLPRRGYRYIGVEPRHDAAAAVGSAERAATGTDAGSDRSHGPMWMAMLALAVLAGVGVASYLSTRGERHAADLASSTPETTARPRLAVLPFENLSPDPANAFFTDGMHEEILTTLAIRAANLEVISRTTMMLYREKPKAVQAVASELGVTHVLEGSVRREGNSVRLTLQLIDARKDARVWSKSFDRKLGDTIALQSAVAEEVASQLAVTLSGNIGELPRSPIPEAYDLYLKSRLAMPTLYAARSPRVQLQALQLLDRAVELDRTFAAAFLARARLRLAMFIGSRDVSEAHLAALRSDLATARSMIGDSAPLLVTEASYAHLVEFDSVKALTLLEDAQARNPNGSEVHLFVARIQGFTGNREKSLVNYQRAAELDPGNPLVASDWATALKLEGRTEEAMRVSRDFDARHPGLITYGWRLFALTGQLQRFENEIARPDANTNPEGQLAARFNLLLYGRRFDELTTLIETTELRTVAQSSAGMLTVPAVGRKPVAELHGWAMMLGKDTAAARRDGDELLEFAAKQQVNRWNAWYLRMLAAEGELFTGDRAAAAREARAALALAPDNIHPGIDLYARTLAARVLAWAGAGDEAVSLLETLSTDYPMAGPAEITRDPLYAIPLAGNARYKILERRLETEIAANQRLRDPD